MPKGVICGGAVDGSNQLGAIVTCQAMTARPAGAGSAAGDRVAANARTAATSGPIRVGHRRRSSNEIIGASLKARHNVDLGTFIPAIREGPREKSMPFSPSEQGQHPLAPSGCLLAKSAISSESIG